jgi:hypothetical protein
MKVKFWQDQIKLYDKEFEGWVKRGKKINERYLDERKIKDDGRDNFTEARYNILWANVETIFPAVYNKMPKPDVSRRYKDKDPVGRVASIMLERALEYEIEQYPDYDASLRNALLDRLLPGRGVAWVRYEPTFSEGEPVTGQVTEDESASTEYVLEKECAPVDYVNWQDFGHAPAKTWEEVPGVWRRVLMDKESLEKRFGSVAKQYGYTIDQIPADQTEYNLETVGINRDAQGDHKKAAVYEVWDKRTGKVGWLCNGMDKWLDVRDDPLKLEGFFPCPKPIYATTSTMSLVPTPDYVQYQDQARELDKVTERINKLVEACKVVGVYDASQTAIKRMLTEGADNELIPVDNWAMFAEKNGIKGVVDWLPLDMVVNALNNLYLARDQIKAVIYEITGIADILRGNTEASETATAQQIKANYAGLRIRKLQMDVATFARDLLRLKAEVICQFFSDETIVKMAGAESFSPEDQQYIGPALQLLRDDLTRGFRIDIETDSMVEADEQADKEAATELLTGSSQFMERVVAAMETAPDVVPLMLEVFMFALRRYKVGKTIEGQYQETFDRLMQKIQNPEPKPDPEMAKVQAEQQREEMRLQIEQAQNQARMQADMAIAQAKAQVEAQLERERMAMQAQLDAMKQEREAQAKQVQAMIDARLQEFKARLDAETKINVAQINSEATLSAQQDQAAEDATE